jgi:hypothetical protein
MKKSLACIALAALLTLPIAIGMSRLPGLGQWITSESGYRIWGPLFRAFNSDGGEQSTDIIVGTILTISFLLALAGSAAFASIVSRCRKRK